MMLALALLLQGAGAGECSADLEMICADVGWVGRRAEACASAREKDEAGF